MAKVENLDAPVGWLMDPHNKWAIHFNFKKGSHERIASDFTIDMWGVVQNGKPMNFKSRRKVTKQDSINTWNQLIESDWFEFEGEKIKTA